MNFAAEVIIQEEVREYYADASGNPTLIYGSPNAAGFDLRANLREALLIPPGGCVKVGTGLRIHLADPSVAGYILPRSGLGHRGIVLGNLVGLIDSDYQGELLVSVWNRGAEDFYLNPGERFAQYLVGPVYQLIPTFVDKFTTASERGESGFGASGKK